jgi:NAD(P)-dependent dehydrogenase (short-subunit alcohol dehydrogenase family)
MLTLNLADLDYLFETVRNKKGHIDVLYANAGAVEGSPIGNITEEHFDKQFNVNARGTLFTVQKALPLIMDNCSIIMTGSVVAQKGIPYLSVYAASKVTLDAFAKGAVSGFMAGFAAGFVTSAAVGVVGELLLTGGR